MTPERLDEILAKVPALKIALLGNVFLDKYFDIDPRLAEVSVETGKQAHQVVGIRCYGGAGGSVAQKLTALGVGWVPAITVIGADGEGYDLKAALQRDRIDTQPAGRVPTVSHRDLWQAHGHRARQAAVRT